MGIRRSTSMMLIALCVFAGVLFAGAGAQAAVIHHYLTRISEIPATGPHGEPVAVARRLGRVTSMTFDSGLLYTAEQTEGGSGVYTLDEFEAASRAFAKQLVNSPRHTPIAPEGGIAVSHATGEALVYGAVRSISQPRDDYVTLIGESGSPLSPWLGAQTPAKEFGEGRNGTPGTRAVAVDDSASLGDWATGDVFVANNNALVTPALHAVDVFKPEVVGGEVKEGYVTQIKGASPTQPFGELVGVAVDEGNGDLVVAEASKVYVLEPTVLGEYELTHEMTATPRGPLAEIQDIAVNSETGDVYVLEGSEHSGEVEEFNSEGVYTGRLTGTPAGAFAAPQSVAVDPTSGDVYVGDLLSIEENVVGGGSDIGVIDVFEPNLVIPDVANAAASNVRTHSATLNGFVNPDGLGPATCQIDWGTSATFGEVAPCAGAIEGTSPVPIHLNVTGLQPDTTYYYRVQATNANGTNPGETTVEFTTPGPGIHAESASDVAPTSASLNATIDPHGSPTTYYFQYGPTTSYGTDVPAPPGVTIGSGESDVEVNPEHLQGLQESTTYHYRVVAISEVEVEPGVSKVEEFPGADETFTTQTVGAFALPDGRQWEMVSTPNKQGALLEGLNNEAQSTNKQSSVRAAAGGGALAYVADIPTEVQPAGYANVAEVFSVRGADGWTSRDVALPHVISPGAAFSFGSEYRDFSEDLSLAVVQPFGDFIPSSSPQALAPHEATEQTAFLRSDYAEGEAGSICASSCYRPLVTGAPGKANVPPGTVFGQEESGECKLYVCGPTFIAATPDLSHIVLRSAVALTQTPAAPKGGLYEWSGGTLALVSVGPNGGAASAPSLGTGDVDIRHALSNDGSRIIWTSGEALYMRDLARQETVKLSGVVSGSGFGPPSVTFQDASGDGSKVFFKDRQELTEGSGEGDLYECEMVVHPGSGLECDLSDLTPAVTSAQGTKENAKPGEAIIGTSADGSYTYFVAGGVLAPGAVPGVCETGSASRPTCNLYVRHDGVTKLIAVLSGEDLSNWDGGRGGWGFHGPELLGAEVSPNGRWLAFLSQRELVPGQVIADAVSGRPDQEVYLYDTQSGSLVCASCNPSGARPTGVEAGATAEGLIGSDTMWESDQWLAATLPSWTSYRTARSLFAPRYLSNSGRLFFNSDDALVPQDVDGTWDVYEYEPLGSGSCATSQQSYGERSKGCVGLISAGTSSQESVFLEASEDGGDVFFLTKSQLAPQDYDGAFDVYDAHECSAAAPCFPPAPLVPPPCSTGDACKAAPSPQPSIFGAPSSATFSGAGNIVSSGSGRVTTKSLTRAQRLAAALKACAKRARAKRAACRARARKRFGAGKASKRSRAGARKAKRSRAGSTEASRSRAGSTKGRK